MSWTTLKDYRTTNFLLNFIHSEFQGWYTRENTLLQLDHPEGNADRLNH